VNIAVHGGRHVRGESGIALYRNLYHKNDFMNEREMFEKSFERPSNYFELSEQRQWEIDKELGILDWIGLDLTKEDEERFKKHYKKHDK